ncbi:hypothetical protein BT69DRAFT_521830 [Atractiella rhizophila]|nr:hypothetical protein BT69DRAFT_521830 [Atractiella rhizophila]
MDFVTGTSAAVKASWGIVKHLQKMKDNSKEIEALPEKILMLETLIQNAAEKGVPQENNSIIESAIINAEGVLNRIQKQRDSLLGGAWHANSIGEELKKLSLDVDKAIARFNVTTTIALYDVFNASKVETQKVSNAITNLEQNMTDLLAIVKSNAINQDEHETCIQKLEARGNRLTSGSAAVPTISKIASITQREIEVGSIQPSPRASVLASNHNREGITSIHFAPCPPLRVAPRPMEHSRGQSTSLAVFPSPAPQTLQMLERSATTHYKAFLSTGEMGLSFIISEIDELPGIGDMIAVNERLVEHRERAPQFCTTVQEFLVAKFKLHINQMEKDSLWSIDKNNLCLPSHAKLEENLGRYRGLMLFMKEVDYERFQQICSAYCSSASDLHRKEMTGLFAAYRKLSHKPTEDEQEASFTYQCANAAVALNKSAARKKLKTGDFFNKLGRPPHQTFKQLVDRIVSQIEREQAFIAEFLHTFSSSVNPSTFADYMDLEPSFKQGAAAMAGQQTRFTDMDMRHSLGKIFGFMATELSAWIDSQTAQDGFQIVGILAVLDREATRAATQRNDFIARMMQENYQKASVFLQKIFKEQTKAIEQTKLTLEKRKGVVPFIRVFPRFVDRIESQIVPSDDRLPARKLVNAVYNGVFSSMLESLEQMAEMEGDAAAAEDSKDKLNYHVIFIENMHHFLTTIRPKKIAPLKPSLDRGQALYDKHLNQYSQVALRHLLSRLLKFFSEMEQLLRTTPTNEVSLHGYTKLSLKETISSFDRKDLKKGTEVLSKQIDKHFGDISNPSAESSRAAQAVWKVCEEEMTKLIKEWTTLICRCFPDDDKLSFDFGVKEIQDVFQKNVPRSAGSMSLS